MTNRIEYWTKLAFRHTGELRRLSADAGRRIIEVYNRDFKVATKDDTSPLTEADIASHKCIIDGLKSISGALGGIPIISEEGDIPDHTERSEWEAWWLIDPLDGTKEFVKKNGEFTVNIALIVRPENDAAGIPIAGWVYAPVLNRLYEGILGRGAVRINLARHYGNPVDQTLPLDEPESPPRIVASRSHRTAETEAVINAVGEKFGKGTLVSSGSSLKLCQIAEGAAELYPRPAPTMEWDTAAADAVCRAAGARVVGALTGEVLKYGKEDLLNPWFLVSRDEALVKESVQTLKSFSNKA